MKNIVFMPSFCNGEFPYYAQRCIDYWKRWCDKNNAEFIISTEYIHDPKEVPCQIQKLYVFDLLESNNVEFDQCALVDWDTFPMPNAKNIFDYTNGKFSVCLDYGYATNIIRSIEHVSQFFKNSDVVSWDNYFNSGLFVFNKTHKDIFKKTIDFCMSHQKEQQENPELFYGDQTALNFIVHSNIETTILPRSFMVHEHFLKIFLNNYVDHHNKYIDAQSYMSYINFIHITDGPEFRNQLVDLVYERFYKQLN